MLFREIVDLLDRKFEFLMKSKREDFMLDLANFVTFLTEDKRVKDFTMKIYSKFAEEGSRYEAVVEKEKDEIASLGNKIKTVYPELDDSNREKPASGHPSIEYECSFAAFEDMVRGVKTHEGFLLYPDMMTDNSDPAKMLEILGTKIQQYETKDENGKVTRHIDKQLHLKYNSLQNQREYNFRKWLNSCRVSEGQAIRALCGIVLKINPEPKQYKSLDEMFTLDNLNEKSKERWFYSWIQDATYGVVLKYSNYKPDDLDKKRLDEIFEELKYKARRIYEAVREEIGSQLLYRQVLNRYMRRSMWYDFQAIWDMVKPGGKTLSNKREHLLTLHLARYLFDNGISVIYRLKAGQHEMDMVDPEAQCPLVLEVKVYVKGAKQDIIQGISQLHAYLNNISATKDVTDGFYVVYRFGGPLYELPEKISTNRFTLHTIVIDMGKSQESGRKQPKPIIISSEEILKQVKQPEGEKQLVSQDPELSGKGGN